MPSTSRLLFALAAGLGVALISVHSTGDEPPDTPPPLVTGPAWIPTDQHIRDHLGETAARARSLDRVRFEVEDGKVTMRGTVPTLSARQRANRLALQCYGVISVHDKLAVASELDDGEILDRVRAMLDNDPILREGGLLVSVDKGLVTLGGTVHRWSHRRLAEELAVLPLGVQGVINKIAVEQGDRQRPRGADLAAAIKLRLTFDYWVRGDHVKVTAQNRSVTLAGRCGTAYGKRRAEQLARDCGAEEVRSEIAVQVPLARHWTIRRFDDKEVQAAVVAALASDAHTARHEISATVSRGVATLRGDVPTVAARRAATAITRQVRTVKRVRNLLIVQPPQVVLDRRLRREIERTLDRFDAPQADRVSVEVEDGHVIMRGARVRPLAALHLQSLIARVEGVRSVADRTATRMPWGFAGTPFPTQELGHDELERDASDDRELADDLQRLLRMETTIDTRGLDIAVKNDRVLIRGTIRRSADRRSLRQLARRAGARSVEIEATLAGRQEADDDRLVIPGEARPDDGTLEAEDATETTDTMPDPRFREDTKESAE